MKKNKRSLLIGFLVVILIVFAYQVFVAINQNQTPQATPVDTTSSTIPTSTTSVSTTSPQGKFCGGIMGLPCPTGFYCKLDGNYPDAGGKCQGASNLCIQNNGKWLEEYQECENITKQTCDSLGGAFSECESACRHQDTEYCIFLCVPVCKF